MTATGAALLVVDVQNDFCPGGALPVTRGDRVIDPANRYIDDAVSRGMPVYVTRDWHPSVTTHFKGHGGVWPPHCIQHSQGAAFHPRLQLPDGAVVVNKGERADSDAYSAFDGHTLAGTPLLDDMRARGITHLYICGLATDYCVRHSTRDAIRAGLRVTVLEDAVAGVELSPGDSDRALAEARLLGARIASGPAVFDDGDRNPAPP